MVKKKSTEFIGIFKSSDIIISIFSQETNSLKSLKLVVVVVCFSKNHIVHLLSSPKIYVLFMVSFQMNSYMNVQMAYCGIHQDGFFPIKSSSPVASLKRFIENISKQQFKYIERHSIFVQGEHHKQNLNQMNSAQQICSSNIHSSDLSPSPCRLVTK